jgi:hypothetical protein
MKRIYALMPFFILVFGCSKEKDEIDSGEVWVRLENATSFILERATVGTISYGDVVPGEKTEYKLVKDPVYSGYCSFMIERMQSAAGYGICGTPMPPPFEPGYYTFIVESSGTAFNTLAVTKDK